MLKRAISRQLVRFGALAALGLSAGSSPLAAQERIPFGFKNLEDAPAAGVRLELETSSRCEVTVVDSGPFRSWGGDRRTISLYNGQIGRRASARVQLGHDCPEPPRIDEWWWLDEDTDRVGSRKRVDPNSPPVSSTYREDRHFQTVVFDPPAGRILLHLPDNLTAGESISGSLSFEAAGEGERDRARSFTALRSYSIELGDADLQLFRQRWTRTLPPGNAGGFLEVSLWDPDGYLVSANAVPLVAQAPPQPADFQVPSIIQAERPLEILGPFDGSFDNTSLAFDGAAVSPQAESRRALVALAPARTTGKIPVTVKEGDLEATRELRSVRVDVVSPKPTIATGERLTLTIEVRGLEGLETPLELEIVNLSVGLAHFLGDPRYRGLTIRPEDAPGGTFIFSLELEGSRGGEFGVAANLKLPR